MLSPQSAQLICEHCLLPVAEREAVYEALPTGQKAFCCHACRSIYLLITEEGLQDFYKKRDWKSFGIPDVLRESKDSEYSPPVAESESLIPFIRGDGALKEADLMIDGIRCSSCIWLNEKILERTKGVISARVNFATQQGAHHMGQFTDNPREDHVTDHVHWLPCAAFHAGLTRSVHAKTEPGPAYPVRYSRHSFPCSS